MLSRHSAAKEIKHSWKLTSGFIGPQILNFERILILSPGLQSSLVRLAKFLLEADKTVITNKEKKLSRHFNFIPRYIDVVLSLRHWCLCLSYLSHWARIRRIPHIHPRCASYLDIHLEIDSEDRVRTKLYEKRGDFNFLFMCSNILAVPAHGVYVSRLIRYNTACVSYNEFFNRGFLFVKLKSSFRMFYGRYHDLVTQYLYHKWPWKFSIYCSHNNYFLIYDLSPGLWKELHDGCHMPTLPEHLTSPRILVRFVLLDL